VLDHLRSRLGETNYQFLKALAEALSDAKSIPHLDEFPSCATPSDVSLSFRSVFSHQLLDFTKQSADGLVQVRRQGAVPEASLRAGIGSGKQ